MFLFQRFELNFHPKKSPEYTDVTVSRLETPLKQHRGHYEANELLLWLGNSLNQGEAGFTAGFTV